MSFPVITSCSKHSNNSFGTSIKLVAISGPLAIVANSKSSALQKKSHIAKWLSILLNFFLVSEKCQ